jgi:hypothetical protein
MAKVYVDLNLAKTFGLSEKDFEGKDEKAQEKILDEAYNRFKKISALRNDTEVFENAKTAIPKLKEFFKAPILVWAQPKPPEKTAAKVQIVGYSGVKDKVLAIKPESKGAKLKVLQYDVSDFISSADDLAKF